MWRAHQGPEATKIEIAPACVVGHPRPQRADPAAAGSACSANCRRGALSASLPRAAPARPLHPAVGLGWTRVQVCCSPRSSCGAAGWAAMVMGLHQPMLLGAAGGRCCWRDSLAVRPLPAKKRLEKFEQQLPEALDLITRALRAGHAFSAALKMAGEEMAEPIAGEFSTVHDEVNFGVSLQAGPDPPERAGAAHRPALLRGGGADPARIRRQPDRVLGNLSRLIASASS